MPTQILSMLKTSISLEVNALGTVMIVMTVGIPLMGGLLAQGLARLKRSKRKGGCEMKLSSTRRLERLHDRYRNGGIDRRNFLGLTAAAAASAGLYLPWAGKALAQVKEVRFDGWGGVVQEAIDKYAFQPFSAKTGIGLVQGTFGDENEHHQGQDLKPRRLPGDPLVRCRVLCKIRQRGAQLGNQRGEHSQHGECASGDDRALPQDDTNHNSRGNHDQAGNHVHFPQIRLEGGDDAPASLAAPSLLRAQSAFEFSIGSSHPLTSLWVGPMKTTFQKEVEEKAAALGFKVNWREAYGGTLYKFQETLTAVRRNFVDIGWVGSIWEGRSLPLENISYFAPFASDDVVQVVESIDKLTTTFKPMTDAWTRNNMVYLGGTGIDTAHLWTTFPVNRFEDLKGRKFSTAGLVANLIKGTGAVAVNSAQTNFYTDIQTGVTEGVMTAGTVFYPTRAYEVAK